MFSSSSEFVEGQARHMACIAYFRLSEELRSQFAKPDGYDAWLAQWLKRDTTSTAQ